MQNAKIILGIQTLAFQNLFFALNTIFETLKGKFPF